MEVRLLAKEKDTIELEVSGVNETLLNPIKAALERDEKVEQVTYTMGHPTLSKPRLFVKVSDGKPQAAIKRAAKALGNEYKDLREAIERKK